MPSPHAQSPLGGVEPGRSGVEHVGTPVWDTELGEALDGSAVGETLIIETHGR